MPAVHTVALLAALAVGAALAGRVGALARADSGAGARLHLPLTCRAAIAREAGALLAGLAGLAALAIGTVALRRGRLVLASGTARALGTSTLLGGLARLTALAIGAVALRRGLRLTAGSARVVWRSTLFLDVGRLTERLRLGVVTARGALDRDASTDADAEFLVLTPLERPAAAHHDHGGEQTARHQHPGREVGQIHYVLSRVEIWVLFRTTAKAAGQ